jgi:hypothetical protein
MLCQLCSGQETLCLKKALIFSTEINEDNRSLMLLMKNGTVSSGKRTKHLDIWYFYVKDLIDRGIMNFSHSIS